MINNVKSDAEQRMKKSTETLHHELAKIRTGRAHPSLVEHITVEYYGTATPLSQVGSVNASDARTLAITPWDRTIVPAIEKAIRNANLGLNPITTGDVIRIPLPAMTEERRKEMTKLVRNETENAKIAIRNIRRDALHEIKELLKGKKITEDEVHRAEDDIQKITDRFIENVDKQLTEKEKDLMAV